MRAGQSFDRFAADYDRFASLEPATLRDWLIRQLPDQRGRALDAGCGSGRHTRALAEQFDEVIGIDISAPLIAIAGTHAPSNVCYVATDLMSFSDATGFDLVLSSTTLHHVAALDAALRHLRGLVRPGGRAILIDNVASRPTPSSAVHILGAICNVPSDVSRLGLRGALWLFKFRIGQAWLGHLASDRYLTRPAFERRYGEVFAGARFADLGYAHGLVWEKKNPAAVARGDEVRREP